MSITAYFASLNLLKLAKNLPGGVSQGIIWGIMALGIYITFRLLDVADLTVDGSFTTGGAVTVMLILGGWPAWAALLAAMCAGLLAGMVTGLLHTKLGIPAILAGILTQFSLYSINLRIMGAPNVSILRMNTVFRPLVKAGLTGSVAIIIVGGLCALALISILYWFFGTELGSAVRATGNNPRMVRAQGINTDSMKILGLVLSNGLVALSGAFIAQSQNFADVQMGAGSIVIGLASLIIGEVLFGGRGFYRRLVAVILGAVVYRLIIALVLELGMNPNDLKLFTAITVALALWLPQGKQLLRTVRKSMGKEAA